MRAVFDERQRAHNPKFFMANGTVLPNPEQPARVDRLFAAAQAAGCAFEAPKDHGIAPLAAVHSAEYLRFLQTIHAHWSRMAGASEEVVPTIHPDRRDGGYPRSAAGLAGYHQADAACPITADTWGAAYWSAQTALSAADMLLQGERVAYAFCRPPGHHAFADMAGGFCYLNNTAVAAQHLRDAGRRPAILDVDVHHGNGTQGVFYDRNDVLTVSIHAHPERFYPFFWGYPAERGEGAGRGANLNIALPRRTTDTGYAPALTRAFEAIKAFGADSLVVALGLDAHKDDPLDGFRLTTAYFGQMAKSISGLGLPSVLVQEGGYPQPALGDTLRSFLDGWA